MERKMDLIIIALSLVALILWGCAAVPSTITFDSQGRVKTAQNYIIADQTRVCTPNIADNWFTSAMKQMLDALGPYLSMFKGLFNVQPVTPTPQPAPTPAPAPRPYP